MDEKDWRHFTDRLRALVLQTSAPGKHAARSALRHTDMAWALRGIDPEMAAFRSITGQEEAATAVFQALRHRRYTGAASINPRKHIHKSALLPFLQAVAEYLFRSAEKLGVDIRLRWPEHPKADPLAIVLTHRLPSGERQSFLPQPPFNFTATQAGVPYDFHVEFEFVASVRQAKSIDDAIKRATNTRNCLLYAACNGIPKVTGSIERRLQWAADHVFGVLTIYLLIEQYPQRQQFVQHALDMFLKLLSRIDPRGLKVAAEP